MPNEKVGGWTTTKDQKLQFVRALVYGESGRGKTTSFRTLNEMTTAIVFAGERGALPLRDKSYLARHVGTWEEMTELADELSKGVDGYKTVCIDSLSGIGEMCKHAIVTRDRKVLIKSRTRGRSESPDSIYEDLMSQEDWGLYLARMKALLGQLTSSPFHLIVTALAAWTPDKRTGTIKKTPALQGRLALEVAQYFDLVFYMDSVPDSEGQESRVWRTASDSTIEAKDASGVLEQMETTDWSIVLRKIVKES
jgi:hypothetical protein